MNYRWEEESHEPTGLTVLGLKLKGEGGIYERDLAKAII